jgi:putative ABC transport system permease protein
VNAATFVMKNALRNKRRALLSVLSVAVSLFLFVTLLVALREITLPPEDVGSALRVVVRNKISIATLLPARQRPILERIPGVEAVSPFTWYGGKYKDEYGIPFAQFAMDAVQVPRIFGELKLPREQYDSWVKNHRGCIIGQETATKYKLKVGDRMNFIGQLWPCDLEFTVSGIYRGTLDDRNLLFHHKYLDEASGSQGQVGTWWLKVRSIDEMQTAIDTINKTFENSSAPVRAETERAFQLSFVSMWGNIKFLVRSICSVVVFTLLLVSASTMSMAVRERFRELAVLKALGYRRRELFGFILAESFGLAMAGAILGVSGAWIFSRNAQRLTQGLFLYFELTPRIAATAFSVAALLGILASIAPSIAVARMSVVNGLKTLD